MRVPILLAGILLTSGGCSLVPGPVESMAKTGSPEVIEADVERVWAHLPDVYASLDLAVTTTDPEAQVVASTRAHNVWGFWVGPHEAPYGRCTVPRLNRSLAAARRSAPVPVSVPPARVMVTVESALVPEGGSTHLRTRVLLSPVALTGTGPREEPYCVSTGRLEAHIATLLRERVRA